MECDFAPAGGCQAGPCFDPSFFCGKCFSEVGSNAMGVHRTTSRGLLSVEWRFRKKERGVLRFALAPNLSGVWQCGKWKGKLLQWNISLFRRYEIAYYSNSGFIPNRAPGWSTGRSPPLPRKYEKPIHSGPFRAALSPCWSRLRRLGRRHCPRHHRRAWPRSGRRGIGR